MKANILSLFCTCFFATIAMTVALMSDASAKPVPPPGFEFLCAEGETCNAGAAGSIIAYGDKGIYSYRALCGTFTCQKETYPRYIETNMTNSCFAPAQSEAGKVAKQTTKTESPPPTKKDKCYAGAVLVNETIDCNGKKIGFSCNSNNEYQSPVMILINSTVKNVVISKEGGSDGIHCVRGDCVLENVIWEDICEDAATMYAEGGTLTIKGGEAFNSPDGPGGKPDKIFQSNAKTGKIVVKDGFVAKGTHGKLFRSCGNCFRNGGPRSITLQDVIIDGTIGSIVGINSNYGDVAEITNLKIKDYKEGSPKICVEYKGVTKTRTGVQQGPKVKSEKIGEMWETASCKVKKSDVSSLDGSSTTTPDSSNEQDKKKGDKNSKEEEDKKETDIDTGTEDNKKEDESKEEEEDKKETDTDTGTEDNKKEDDKEKNEEGEQKEKEIDK